MTTPMARPGRQRRPSGEPPPLPRQLNRVAFGWLAAFAVWIVVWAWFFIFGGDSLATWITRRDLEVTRPMFENRVAWLTNTTEAVNEVAVNWLVPLLGWVVIIGCLVTRRFRHLLVYLAVLTTTAGLITLIAWEIKRPRPFGAPILGDWQGYAHPSRPVALLTVAAMGIALTLVPAGLARRRFYWGAAISLAVISFAQVYLAVDHPTDALTSITMAVAISMLAFRLITPEEVFPVKYGTGRAAHLELTDRRQAAIRKAVTSQLGVTVTEIERVGLAGSAGSTPLLLTLNGESGHLFAKIYARNHLRSDRWYKLGRTLLYGRLEDEQPFNSVRRLVQHEDYLLHVLKAHQVPVPHPHGIIEITPDREYLIVMEFLEGSIEVTDAEVTEAVIDNGLDIITRLWAAGVAHRDLKPANIMIRGDEVMLIDVAFAQVQPSPWREAVDLANMMLVLALRSSPEAVYERARLRFTDQELSEAFAASRGVTLPSQLRRDIRADGRELLEAFRELVPPREPVKIQRWSVRRIGLSVGVLLLGLLIVGSVLGGLNDTGYFG
jgi:tRNA A-37 threonylcarbamoyl transferase component Bud32